MKRKMIIAGVSAILIFGGAIAVGAAKSESKENHSSVMDVLPQPDEQKLDQGQFNVKWDDDDNPTSSQVATVSTISFKEASEIALKTVNGTIMEAEREFDDGKLEYKFEIKTGKGEVEINIDAQTGKVTEVDYDNDDDFDDDDDRNDD